MILQRLKVYWAVLLLCSSSAAFGQSAARPRVKPFSQETRTEYRMGALARGVRRILVSPGKPDTLLVLFESGDIERYETSAGELRSVRGPGAVTAAQRALLQPHVGTIGGRKAMCHALNSATREEAAGTDRGLFVRKPGAKAWTPVELGSAKKSWGYSEVTALVFDPAGNLWVGTPAGLARRSAAGEWSFFTGSEGVAVYDFTCAAPAPDGSVWFGTKRGAIHFDGGAFRYRAGRRWLPDDDVRDVVAAGNGDVWIATAKGLSRIRRQAMTLRGKAEKFENLAAARHNRLGYVTEARLREPGNLDTWYSVDTDNDGLWTGMYGAAECFRYAATRDPEARALAKRSIDAMILLEQVTGIPGFPARAILPASGPDINLQYTVERDRQQQVRDPLWKVISPRWPRSKDGLWYWKCDTSSDEMDGHFFNFAVYYDLVADTPEEKKRISGHVRKLMDHILDHGYYLVDHDGKPTRWGVWAPEKLNWDINWSNERGLNSLEILSFLKVAEHVTGDPKYSAAYAGLIREHGYHVNVVDQKRTFPPSEINDSDDEMAFMCFYTLLSYEKDPALRALYARGLYRSWLFERIERNPLFNFITAAVADSRAPSVEWQNDLGDFGIADGIDTLKRIPLDLISWSSRNSHRKDIVRDPSRRGYQRTNPDGTPGGVLCADENTVLRWNANPFQADTGDNGMREYEPTFWLLPYYLGLYHKLFSED